MGGEGVGVRTDEWGSEGWVCPGVGWVGGVGSEV